MTNVTKNVMTTETVNVRRNVMVNVTATAAPVDNELESMLNYKFDLPPIADIHTRAIKNKMG